MPTRRALLAGASAVVLSLFMPAPAGAPPLDTEALNHIAQRVRHYLGAYTAEERNDLFQYALGRTFRGSDLTDWLSEEHVTRSVHLTLQATFRALRLAATQDGHDFPLMQNGRLTAYGQIVLTGLPLAPADYEKSIFPALNRVAPHYLS